MAGQIPNEKTIDDTIDLMKEGYLYSELPTTYQPYGLIEVGASRLIVAFTSQRKLTELTSCSKSFVTYDNANKRNPSFLILIAEL